MNSLSTVLKMILRVFFTLRKIGFPRLYNENADVIVWAPTFFTLKFLASDNLQRVLATYQASLDMGKVATIYTGLDVGRFKGKIIFYFAEQSFYNVYGFSDYVAIMHHISDQLCEQGNKVFPSPDEVRFWENKIFMHERFDALGVRSPDTKIVSLDEGVDSNIEFPCLIKEPHSCSAMGVHKVNDFDDLNSLISTPQFRSNNNKLIVQRLLNMRSDLRVILTGDKVIWHYWRRNLSEDWKPTSTGNGGGVDFGNFPEQWRDWIVDQFRILGITTGAFDIAWDDDDLSTEPYILEVSPFYQPNPIPSRSENLIGYGRWKKSISLSDNYQRAMVDLLIEIQTGVVKEVLSNKS